MTVEPYREYFIPMEDVLRRTADGRHYYWPLHMMSKDWVDISSFMAAFNAWLKSCPLHDPVDEATMALTISEIRRQARAFSPVAMERVTRVFVDLGVSVDGKIAGPNRRPGNPLGDGALAIHDWMFGTKAFRELLGWPGGTASPDDARIDAIFGRAGAYIMGRRMFDEGEVGWPEEAPFRAPVFVLTHTPREPWVRKGGTTFHFVTDGIDSALRQARAAAGGKDVRISGGAGAVHQYLRAGAVDELTLHIAPVLLGDGLDLFEGFKPDELKLEQESVASSPLATHITYRVVR